MSVKLLFDDGGVLWLTVVVDSEELLMTVDVVVVDGEESGFGDEGLLVVDDGDVVVDDGDAERCG